LLYHYFVAKEMYNAIRVFIAAYVWMTGFGNFSYYYVRKDFSVGRFCQVSQLLSSSESHVQERTDSVSQRLQIRFHGRD
jgi:hypothetical protein